MCVEMLLIGSALLGAGAAINSANQQAKAAEETGRNLASQAGQEQDAANAQADQIRKAARRQRAAAESSFAAGGVDVGVGSAIAVDNEIARGGEFDALNAIITGGRGADSLTQEAIAYGKQARNAKMAGYGQAASSLLSAGAGAMKASGWRAPASGVGSPMSVNGSAGSVNVSNLA
ncbi:hypothetical protein [Aquabacterium sp.]|uniref:hypothetical protein n=1 Tax=Aquabacterium sp. TaxID=1872578 RepID=UPI003CFEA5B6